MHRALSPIADGATISYLLYRIPKCFLLRPGSYETFIVGPVKIASNMHKRSVTVTNTKYLQLTAQSYSRYTRRWILDYPVDSSKRKLELTCNLQQRLCPKPEATLPSLVPGWVRYACTWQLVTMNQYYHKHLQYSRQFEEFTYYPGTYYCTVNIYIYI